VRQQLNYYFLVTGIGFT